MDYEARLQRFYEQILAPGMCVVDVGAHIGRHGFEMLRLIEPHGRILLFEPLPNLFAQLDNAARSRYAGRNVQVLPYALSNQEGTSEFCIALDALAYSGIKERHYDTETRVSRITVEVRRLDDFVQDWPRLDYIKIDTEGAEWNVLQGSLRSIERFRPTVSFEFGENSYSAYDVSPGAVHDFFMSARYIVLDILGNELDKASFIESSRHQAVWDYVALPEERRSQASLLSGHADN
ncbi:MAG: hypothetical protein BGP10_05755 [Rhodanobacter sp. 68-29]|nr:FkbM family methyltransferase [Rhodanobacter sp.]ODU75069.1 MAG: hypothetical protein ABT17_05135 [Rhodanobacter sp. SCN 69-32]OJY55347.1 MAG: hypothetical protein BGP10_05755 [Rhodanobacter sp. 68-29]